MNPAGKNFTAFFDNTFELSIILKDDSGTDIPASNYTAIRHIIFSPKDEDNPHVENDLDSGITVTNGNTLNFVITAEENKDLYKKFLYHKLIFETADSKETYIADRYEVLNLKGKQNDGTYTLSVDQDNLEVTLELTEASVATALAVQAKNDAEQAVSDIGGLVATHETTVGNHDDVDLGAKTEGRGLLFDASGNLVESEISDGGGIDPLDYDAKSTLADADKISGFDSEATDNPVTWAWSVIKSAFATYYNSVTATITNKTLGDNLNADGNKVVNLATPTDDADSATKKYTDDKASLSVAEHNDVNLGNKTEGRGLLFDSGGNLTESSDAIETTSGAQSKVDTHENKSAPHSGHETPSGAQTKVDTHENKSAPHSGHETPSGAQTKVDTHAQTVGNHDDVDLGAKTEGRGLLFDASGNLVESEISGSGGSSLTVGSENQIPRVNATGDDLNYSDALEYDPSNQRLNIRGDDNPQIRLVDTDNGFPGVAFQNEASGDEAKFELDINGRMIFKTTGSKSIVFGTNNQANSIEVNGDGSVDIKKPLTNESSYTQDSLSTDPPDPSAGSTVQWVSDGTGSGDAGDVMMKINVGGTVKTVTLIDYSAI